MYNLRLLLTRVAYPALLAAVLVVVLLTLRSGWDLGLVSFVFLAGTIGYLATLERVIPYMREWLPSTKEWGWYGVYFVLAMLGGGLAQMLVVGVVGLVSPADPALPLGVEIPLALLLASLAGYLVHRMEHTNSWLWRLHGVHHVPEKVNVGNNGVNHIVDIVLAQGVVQSTLAVVGFSHESVFVVGIFVTAQAYFIHANIDVRIGWLNYILASPEQHRLHHSTVVAEAGHFSSDLSIWDLAFGSFTWYPGRAPAAVGLSEPGSFPATEAVVASMLHPWRQKKSVEPSA